MNNKFIGDPYWVSPEDIKIDERIAGFNPKKIEEDYTALKHQIKTNGQTQPVYLRNGYMGDGRTRHQIAKELGIKLKAIDINPEMSDAEYMTLCNENTFGSRNDTSSQKAIKAYKLVKEHKFSETEAKLIVGIKDKNILGYLKTIADSKYKDIINKIHNNEEVEIEDAEGKIYKGTSLRRISTIIKKLEEQAVLETDKSEEIKDIQIDYNSKLKTEKAIEIFWAYYGRSEDLTHEAKVLVCEMLNLKFKKKTDTVVTAVSEANED